MSHYDDSHYPTATPYPFQQDQSNLAPHSFGLERSESEYSSSSTLPHKYNTSLDIESNAPQFSVQQAPIAPQERWWSRFLPNSLACRLYIGVVVVETIIDLAIEAALYNAVITRKHVDGEELDTIAKKQGVYLALFAVAHVCQLGLAIDAVVNRNTLQFYFLALLNGVFIAYAAVQPSELAKTLNPDTFVPLTSDLNALTAVTIATTCIAEVAYLGLGWQIQREFGWKVYKFLGADRRIKQMYLYFQIFESLVKFDVLFWVGFSIQLIVVVLSKDWEYYITILALPLSLLLLIQGLLAVRFENRFMMYSFMTGCVAACVYFAYKLFRIYQNPDDPSLTLVRNSLTIFASISIVFLLITFAVGCVVLSNFGAGLRDQMRKGNKSSALRRRGTETLPKGEHYAMSANPNRMSID